MNDVLGCKSLSDQRRINGITQWSRFRFQKEISKYSSKGSIDCDIPTLVLFSPKLLLEFTKFTQH